MGTVENASEEGLFLRSAFTLRAADTVAVEVGRPGDLGHLLMVGTVRWTSAEGAGLSILAMLPHHRQRYSDLLRHAARASGTEAVAQTST